MNKTWITGRVVIVVWDVIIGTIGTVRAGIRITDGRITVNRVVDTGITDRLLTMYRICCI